jgi:putative ABC transport system permease protein
MIAVALKGLAGRKVRAVLTALAIVIGISMVSGTYILTDTMQKSFDGLFSATYDKTDAVITTKEIVKGSTNASGTAPIPAALLAKIQDLPQVDAAGGAVSPDEANAADILGRDGKPVARESVGGSYDPAHRQFSPLELKSGKWAEGPQQVVIDAGTFSKQHYKLGQTVTISTSGTKRTFTLTGTVSYGDVDSLGFASIAAWDVKTAQTLLHREGGFDQISIAAKKGTSSAELVRAVQPLVTNGLQVKDSAKQAKADAAELNSSMSILKYFLLGFGALSLLVGAFVIFNTLSITVAQRTREFATLRTLGGSRKQVMRAVVLEGGVIGLLASVLGLLAGIGLAKGMVALFSAMGFELPTASTVIEPRTIVVSLVVGTVVTLIASVLPARRATRVPPIAAVREVRRCRPRALPRTRSRPASASSPPPWRRCSPACSSAGSARSFSSRCSPVACSVRSSAWRCSLRTWSGRWPASSACRRGPSAAPRVSWPAPTPSATPAAPRPRPRR